MSTDNSLFPNEVKWRLIPYDWSSIPCAYCALVLGLSACTNLPDSTLQIKDGVVYACVNASSSKEDKCYKVEDKSLPPKGTATPE
jgi:hypothetical protein